MKTLKTLLFSMLMISSPVFAMQLCPASLTVDKGNPITSPGWTVSDKEISGATKFFTVNFEFGMGGYNTKPDGSKDNRISCYYYSNNERNKISMVVITTDQTGFAKPSTAGTKWKFDDTNTFAFCGMGEDNVKPEDCPWG